MVTRPIYRLLSEPLAAMLITPSCTSFGTLRKLLLAWTLLRQIRVGQRPTRKFQRTSVGRNPLFRLLSISLKAHSSHLSSGPSIGTVNALPSGDTHHSAVWILRLSPSAQGLQLRSRSCFSQSRLDSNLTAINLGGPGAARKLYDGPMFGVWRRYNALIYQEIFGGS